MATNIPRGYPGEKSSRIFGVPEEEAALGGSQKGHLLPLGRLEPPTERMPSAKYLLLTMLVSFIATFSLVGAFAPPSWNLPLVSRQSLRNDGIRRGGGVQFAAAIGDVAKRQADGNSSAVNTPPPVTVTTTDRTTITSGGTTQTSTSSSIPPPPPPTTSTSTSSSQPPPPPPPTSTSTTSSTTSSPTTPTSSSSASTSTSGNETTKSSSTTSSRSLRPMTSTFTSTLSDGAVAVVTMTSYVAPDNVDTAASTTKPTGSLQNAGLQGRNLPGIWQLIVAGVAGGVLFA